MYGKELVHLWEAHRVSPPILYPGKFRLTLHHAFRFYVLQASLLIYGEAPANACKSRFLARVTLTLTYELGLDILKMYLHTKNEFSRSRLLKVRARTGQTHRLTNETKRSTIGFAGGKNNCVNNVYILLQQ